jgi:transcriptional regulator with XRE-family HTH domain
MTGGINDTKIVKVIIGERIKQARKLNNKMTQQALADRLSGSKKAPILNGKLNAVSQNRLKKWEDGTNPVELEWIPAICDVLGCDVGYLFGEYEELTRQVSDICKATGLSEDAVEAIRSMGDINLKGGVLHRAEFQEVISCMFEDPRFSSMIPHVIEAERLRTSPEIDQDTTAMELTQSMGKVESLGFVVLRREDARQFHLRQAAQVFLSVVSDIGMGASNGK